MLLESPEFTDNRGRYPESIRAHVPRGTNAALKRVAEAVGVKPAELVRNAVLERLEASLTDTSTAECQAGDADSPQQGNASQHEGAL
jgi:hypothetical protein